MYARKQTLLLCVLCGLNDRLHSFPQQQVGDSYLHHLSDSTVTNLYTVKKVSNFPVPSRDVTNQPLIKFFPVRESLIRDIPARDVKSLTFFNSVEGLDRPPCSTLYPFLLSE